MLQRFCRFVASVLVHVTTVLHDWVARTLGRAVAEHVHRKALVAVGDQGMCLSAKSVVSTTSVKRSVPLGCLLRSVTCHCGGVTCTSRLSPVTTSSMALDTYAPSGSSRTSLVFWSITHPAIDQRVTAFSSAVVAGESMKRLLEDSDHDTP